MKLHLTSYLILATTAAALAGDLNRGSKESTPAGERTPITGHWRFSAGAAWRSIGGVDWQSGPSYSAGLAVPSLVGAGMEPGFGTAGPLTGFANREYSDGNFVRIGSPTAATGETWNWGYTNAGQVADDNLSYQTAGGPSSDIIRGATPLVTRWNEDDPDGFAPFFGADYMFDLRPNLAAGLQLSFMFTSFDSGNRSSNFTGFQERRDYTNMLTDTYRLEGSIPPAAPYQGSFNGPGILLHNIPDQRVFAAPTLVGTERVDLFNSVSESLDVDLCTFSVGFQTEFHKGRLSARGGAGLAVNIANVEAGRKETLSFTRGAATETFREWPKETTRDTKVLPGLYLSAEAAYALNERWSLSLFGRHDWNEDIIGRVGPSQFNVNLDGWTAGVTVNWVW